jgi:hypothetical protein
MTDLSIDPFFMPNDTIVISAIPTTVVATVIYCEDEGRLEQTLLVLFPEKPFFGVYVVDVIARSEITGNRFYNIIEATNDYQQWGGDI